MVQPMSHRMGRVAAGLLVGVLAPTLLVACHGGTHRNLTVTTTADGHDAVPGDGSCEMTVGAGDCSLRAAIDETNASSDVEATINLPTGTYPLTLAGADDTNAGGDLDILQGTITVVIPPTGAAITATGLDAGFDVRGGSLDLRDASVTGATGPGIAVRAGASLVLNHASLHHNGGAGLLLDAGATAHALFNTFADNAGPGLAVDGTLVLGQGTITANGTGVTGAGAITLGESVVADQASGADCTRPVTSAGRNLDSDGTCGLGQPDDLTTVGEAQLGALTTGRVPFHRPAATSPAVDSIPVAPGVCGSGFHAADQRGAATPQGPACDRGAIEREAPISLTVDNPIDVDDAVPGDGRCDRDAAPVAPGDCTMRAAVTETNTWAGPDTVTIASGIDPTLSIPGAGEDANATGDLDVADDLTLHGNASTIDAALLDRALDIRWPADVSIDQVTITHGQTPNGENGGGIRSGGTLSLDRALVTGNGSGDGGGIFIAAGTITDSTFSNNTALNGGGLAVANVTISGTTVTGNQAQFAGGGLVTGWNDVVDIVNSTFSGNRAGVRGAAAAVQGSFFGTPTEVHLRDVTVAENTGSASLTTQVTVCPRICFTYAVVQASGSVIVGGGGAAACSATLPSGSTRNLAPDGTCGPTLPGSALLGPLADNGGPTLTHLPAAGSGAIDAVPAGTAGLCDGSVATDQRGVTRPQGAACDAGAVER